MSMTSRGIEMRSAPSHDDRVSGLEADGWCALNLDVDDEADSEIVRNMFAHELVHDEWLPRGHDYRSRAYQCFTVDPRTRELDFIPDPPPYVQAAEINSISGGLRRAFHGVSATHPVTAIVRRLADVFLDLTLESGIARADEEQGYLLDVHFIRISAPGKPCPEGVHRDGLVAGSVHLIALTNVDGGKTHFSTDDGEPLQSLQLTRFLDSVVFDDQRLLHYTDDISPHDPLADGHRDVLLLGLREQAG
jgi:hypothetical protein